MLAEKKAVNLRTVAERVGLAPCSVSAVLNHTPAAQAIPQATKDRVFRAAAELNYRPNLWARSLRTKRTRMVSVVTPDFGQMAVARVISGLQSQLHRRGYMLVLGSIESADPSRACAHFRQHGVEGVVAINTSIPGQFELPTAHVELGHTNSLPSLTHDVQAWLSELGVTAAETILLEIEKKNPSSRLEAEAKLPTAALDLLHAGLISGIEARETA